MSELTHQAFPMSLRWCQRWHQIYHDPNYHHWGLHHMQSWKWRGHNISGRTL